MANTAKYDRGDVVGKATDLFWEKGFHATSMRNLQDAIDMRPGSIYASFGSKEGLFKESLRAYTTAGLNRLAAYEAEYESPLEALKRFVRDLVAGCADSPSNICMLVKSISELTGANAELLEESKRLLGTMEDAFAALISKAKESGELDPSKDPNRMARHLQMELIGLRGYIRAKGRTADIDELVEDVLTSLR